MSDPKEKDSSQELQEDINDLYNRGEEEDSDDEDDDADEEDEE